MRYLNTVIAMLIISITPATTFAFDADVKQRAKHEAATFTANNFSKLIDISDYGGCSLAYAGALGVWGSGHLTDKDTQLLWEVIGNGLTIYRQNFIRQYGTEKPLGDVIKQLSGPYFNVNEKAIIQTCTDIAFRATSAVR